MADPTVVDPAKFVQAAVHKFGALNASQQAGLARVVTDIGRDPAVTDLHWAAYMLATVKHECANQWKPIAEFGHGQSRPYGLPVQITDSKGNHHTNIYYGRGYVQLTWEGNYRKMDMDLKLNERLWTGPDLALDPDVAAGVMSYGMRNGVFTGRKLSAFSTAAGYDYVEARTIINAHDQAPLIAGYAAGFEAIYRALGSA